MILTLGNTKGGVGKSTLAINIAIFRACQGRKVWLVDGDTQGSSLTAIGVRAHAERTPGVACAQYSQGSILQSQVKHQGSGFDDVIIDAGGRDTSALRAALVVSDAVLVPFAPCSLDVWALDAMAKVVEEARMFNPKLVPWVVLNLASPGDHPDHREAEEAVASHGMFRYLDTPIRQRKAFSNGIGEGMAVFELKRRDRKAEGELSALTTALFTYQDKGEKKKSNVMMPLESNKDDVIPM